jgi:hypothetical protein
MYSNFTEDELIEVYSTMLNYSGKASPEILDEIDRRGGLDKFKTAIKQKELSKKESGRVFKELTELVAQGLDMETIKKKIASDVWTKQHLDDFIENKYLGHQLYIQDKTIDKDVFFRSFLGVLFSSVAGSILWAFSILFLKFIFFPFLIFIYIISYFIIRGLTGKSRNNLIVFLACLIATIASFVLGLVLLTKI